ncbi:MAG: hypothetical protein ACRD51_05055 [Candidatus Acidiferrum sp.]
MKARRIVAALLLLALPLFVMSVATTHVAPVPSSHQGAEMYALGVDGGWGLAFGIAAAVTCAAFVGPAAIGCGIAAAG